MNNQYNIWNKWDPLKTVMLGNNYGPEFFRDIKNNKIRSTLTQIADETLYDLDNFKNVLKDFGCEVLQPTLDPSDSIMNYINDEGKFRGVPRAPLQPRDAQVVIGNKLFCTGPDHHAIADTLMEYNNKDLLILSNTPLVYDAYQNIKCDESGDWPDYNSYLKNYRNEDYFKPHVWAECRAQEDKNMATKDNFRGVDILPGIDATNITLVGNDLYFDNEQDNKDDYQRQYVQEHVKLFKEQEYIKNNFRMNNMHIGGHNDSIFGLLKPGVLLSVTEYFDTTSTFNNWDVCQLNSPSWERVLNFKENKFDRNHRWWAPGQEDNEEFAFFVESWLSSWVGYIKETVFDVNVLVLDEKHVCISQKDNPIVNAFLKKHGIEGIYIPWRHRFFWDGGLHCITLDLYREGRQQDYTIFDTKHQSFS